VRVDEHREGVAAVDDDFEAVARVQALRRIVGVHAQTQSTNAVALRARDHRSEQQRAHPLAPELGVHADRELRDVVGDIAVAGRGDGEAPHPHRAHRLVAAIERVQRDIAGAAPVADIARVLRNREDAGERGPFLGAVVVPVDGLVEHLGEERGVGVRAEPEHRPSLG